MLVDVLSLPIFPRNLSVFYVTTFHEFCNFSCYAMLSRLIISASFENPIQSRKVGNLGYLRLQSLGSDKAQS